MLKPYGYEIAFGFLVGALASSIFWTALPSPLQPPYSTENQQGTKGTYKEAAKVSADDRIADYTEWLAVLTGGRVIVAAIQIGFLIRTDKTARISADAAKQSAHAAKESAAAAQASVQLAIAKQRAYIFAEVIGNNARAWKNGERFAWEYKITNYGESPAIIQRVSALAAVTDVIPGLDGARQAGAPRFPIRSDLEIEAIPPNSVLAVGHSHAFKAEAWCGSLDIFILDQERLNSMPETFQVIQRAAAHSNVNHPLGSEPEGTLRLWLVGMVIYEDVSREKHETRFCFRGTAGGIPPSYEEYGGEEYNRRT